MYDNEDSINMKKSSSLSMDEEQYSNTDRKSEETTSVRPEYLSNIENFQKIRSESFTQLFQTKKMVWDKEFRKNFTATVIQTNFQRMKIQLHYGNIKLNISLIFTQISQNLFFNSYSQSGSFGTVRYFQYQQKYYAIKCVKILNQLKDSDLFNVYKEYFMCFVAGALRVGPIVDLIFGFDIVICNGMAFFAMEKCAFPLTQNLDRISTEMLQNLKIIHSINFIHNDIKPSNIAYSCISKKHVFIDFGLSKLILQQPGQKTRTKFQGTLAYCSEQMKRCYILNNWCFIDLYQNDHHCLNKSMKVFEKPMIIHDKLRENFVDHESQNQLNSHNAIYEEIILILKLKFCLYQEDLQGLLVWLRKQHYLTQTFYEIIISQPIFKKFQLNQQFKQYIELLKTKIYCQQFKPINADSMFCCIFNHKSRKQILQKIIPISYILQLGTIDFEELLRNRDWVYKLFVFIDPFKNNQDITDDVNLKSKIINKIYFALNSSTEPMFFAVKVRFVLIFFYDALKPLKNWRIMLALRMLFLSLQEIFLGCQIQDEILELIEDKTLRMLKMVEFNLAIDIIRQDQNHNKKLKWKQQIENISSKNELESQIKSIALKLFMNNRYFLLKNKQKDELIALGIKLQSLNLQNEAKQAIHNIKFLIIQIINKPKYYAWPKGISKTFSLKIYSKYFYSIEIKCEESSLIERNFIVFKSILEEVKHEINTMQIEQRLAAVLNVQYVSSKNADPFFFKFFSEYYLDEISRSKKVVTLLFHKSKQQIQNPDPDDMFLVQTSITFLFSFLHILWLNEFVQIEQRLNSQEKSTIFDQIQIIINRIIKNQNLKRNQFQWKDLRISALSLRANLMIKQDRPERETQPLIQQVFALMKPLPTQNPNLTIAFIETFQGFYKQVKGPNYHFSQDILLQMADEYLKSEHFYFFERQSSLLNIILQIQNRREKFDYSFNLICRLIDQFKQENYFFKNNVYFITIAQAITTFSDRLPEQQYQKYYNILKLNKLSKTCGFYSFFLLSLFRNIAQKIDEHARYKQMIQTTLSLPKMPQFLINIAKPTILILFRVNKWHKSKRVVIVCARKEANTNIKPLLKEIRDRKKQMQLSAPVQILTKFKQKGDKIY